MARIDDRELVEMGGGALYKHNKLYIPARVVEFLGLDAGEEVTYYQIFDPDYKDVVVIKKA